MKRNVFFNAPNIHTGGGLILLSSLFNAWEENNPCVAVLDVRAKASLVLPDNISVKWVFPKVFSRLYVEYWLWRNVQSDDYLFCFHGLPPLFIRRAHVVVFLQNRLLIRKDKSSHFPLRVTIRLFVERLLLYILRFRVSEYIVQTSTMQRDVIAWYGGTVRHSSPIVTVMPFRDKKLDKNYPQNTEKLFDFIYVADGSSHKNHRRLIEAWCILKEQGINASLALTLSPRDVALTQLVKDIGNNNEVHIQNLGEISHNDVLNALSCSKALIFPSTSESFGLPLIEAEELRIPILAAERDFVRDVCSPVETFDPESAVSIANAVMRFLGHSNVHVMPISSADFLSKLFSDK